VAIMSARTSVPSSRLLLACCLLDHTVYARRLQRAWLTPQHLESKCRGTASCQSAGRRRPRRAVARRVGAALVPLCLALPCAPLARSCCLSGQPLCWASAAATTPLRRRRCRHLWRAWRAPAQQPPPRPRPRPPRGLRAARLPAGAAVQHARR
jgi:hypothetical protein